MGTRELVGPRRQCVCLQRNEATMLPVGFVWSRAVDESVENRHPEPSGGPTATTPYR